MKKLFEQFWSKVKIGNPDECWEWQASKYPAGYGTIKTNGRVEKAHRLSWLMFYGYIPSRLLVCHHCDNPSCVNPKHLFLGTDLDNARDRDRKHRGNSLKGEEHKKAKLTYSQVKEIRHLYANGKFLEREIGELYGITQVEVSRIVLNKVWK